MSRKPRLLLSRQALADNYQRLSSFSGQAECAASIKANAYGVGIEFAAPVLWEAGCRTYFVAYLEEALALFCLPMDLGETPEGEKMVVNIGRFGPYVKYGSKYVSINKQ